MRTISKFFREDLENIPSHERTFHFLLRPLQDLHHLLDDPDHHLAPPEEVFLHAGGPGASLFAYPVLLGDWSRDLLRGLQGLIREEVKATVEVESGLAPDRRRIGPARETLRQELDRCLEACSFSSQGRITSSIFWLWLSHHTAEELSQVPRLVLERDRQVGREKGDRIKYQIFQRLAGLLIEVNREVNGRMVGEVGRRGGEFLSHLVLQMKDNVLIFTEEYLDRDLSRLGTWLSGSLGRDPTRFLGRLRATRDFALQLVERDPVIEEAVRSLGEDSEGDGQRLFFDGRLAALAFRHRKYSRRKYLDAAEQTLFLDLSARLRLFELLTFLRRRVLQCRERRDGTLQTRHGGREILLSRDTPALDFARPGALETQVHRFGLVYDIRDFTATLEQLRRQGTRKEKTALKHLSVLHELLYAIQERRRLTLEKFLGDGAFYTGVSARSLLQAAADIQALYADLRRRGFVFNRGIRLAVNHHTYNLLPIRGGGEDGEYLQEYHGPGLVELNRLTTGKTSSEIREVKEFLLGQGYRSDEVHRFFEPLERSVEGAEEGRIGEFGARLGTGGSLINEGIVTTRALLERLSEELGREAALERRAVGRHGFVGWIEEGRFLGLREMGTARLKGLEPQRLYEVRCVAEADLGEAAPMKARTLVEAVERAYRHDQERISRAGRTPTA